jgi:hypothetical protein
LRRERRENGQTKFNVPRSSRRGFNPLADPAAADFITKRAAVVFAPNYARKARQAVLLRKKGREVNGTAGLLLSKVGAGRWDARGRGA